MATKFSIPQRKGAGNPPAGVGKPVAVPPAGGAKPAGAKFPAAGAGKTVTTPPSIKPAVTPPAGKLKVTPPANKAAAPTDKGYADQKKAQQTAAAGKPKPNGRTAAPAAPVTDEDLSKIVGGMEDGKTRRPPTKPTQPLNEEDVAEAQEEEEVEGNPDDEYDDPEAEGEEGEEEVEGDSDTEGNYLAEEDEETSEEEVEGGVEDAADDLDYVAEETVVEEVKPKRGRKSAAEKAAAAASAGTNGVPGHSVEVGSPNLRTLEDAVTNLAQQQASLMREVAAIKKAVATGKPVVIEEEAPDLRTVFKQFLQGLAQAL